MCKYGYVFKNFVGPAPK